MVKIECLKFMGWLLALVLICCKPGESEKSQTLDEDSVSMTDADKPAEEEKREWDYSPFYGNYIHESNTRGFSAQLELTPQGNDIQFSLSVMQGGCETSLTGILGMIDHGKLEYIGFYSNEQCRLQFNFVLNEMRVQIREVTFCTLHQSGCSFEGEYRKVNSPN